MSWAAQPTHVPCSLEARYGAGGDAFAIRAVQETTNAAISTLKLLLCENRPVPHTEPAGPRDNLEDGIRVYFIDPPLTEPLMDGVCFFFENQDDHRLFQCLVYDQDLALSVKVKKVSSSLGPEADSQYIRVWETRDPECKRSMLYYASNRSKPRKHSYVRIAADDVTPGTKIPKKGDELQLKLQNQPVQSVRIKFTNRNDLEEFARIFLCIVTALA